MEAISNIRRSRALQGSRRKAESIEQIWPCPEDSTGKFIATVGRQGCYEATGLARTVFLAISQDIKQYLDTHTEPSPYWVTWSIYMIGNQPTTTVPTIIFCCENEAYRKTIRDTVRLSGVLDKHPAGIALKHLPRAPDYKHLVQLASNSGASNAKSAGAVARHEVLPGVYSMVRRPNYGDTLWIVPGQGLCPRKATAGGMIWYRGMDYLTTAAHAFHNVQSKQSEMYTEHEELYFTDSDDEDFDMLSQASRSSGNLSISSSFSSINMSHDNMRHDNLSMVINSPVQPVNRQSESSVKSTPIGVPHIPHSAVLIGHLLFSSIESSEAGLDYALIRLEMNDLGHYGPLDLPQSTNEETLNQDCHKISLLIRTSSAGTVEGPLQPNPVFLRTPNAIKYQQVYTVNLSKQLAAGDCGSWAFAFSSSGSRQLYGHVIAGSADGRTAVLVPAFQIFADIKRMLPTIEVRLQSVFISDGTRHSGWSDEHPSNIQGNEQLVRRPSSSASDYTLYEDDEGEDFPDCRIFRTAMTRNLEKVMDLDDHSKTKVEAVYRTFEERCMVQDKLVDLEIFEDLDGDTCDEGIDM